MVLWIIPQGSHFLKFQLSLVYPRNLFGSNIFNVAILAVDDIFFAKGPILSFTDPAHAISTVSAIAMTAIAIIGLTYRAEKKQLFLAWDSIGIVLVYVLNLILLYLLK